MEDKDDMNLVKNNCINYDDSRLKSIGIQFLNNLKRIKARYIAWVANRKIRQDLDLKRTEDSLDSFHEQYKEGFISLNEKRLVVSLEVKHTKILDEKEATWCLKGKAIWIKKEG